MALKDFIRKSVLNVPGKARKELDRRGVEYNELSFLKMVESARNDEVLLFLEAGIDPNAKNSAGESALIVALQVGNAPAVRALLAAEGVDRNQKDGEGRPPAVFAVMNGHLEVLQALIEGKVNLSQPDAEGNPALIHAIRLHKHDLAQELIAGGANVDTRNNSGFSAVMLAVMEDDVAVAGAMINAGADVLVQNHATLESALILAAQRGSVSMVELLLRNAITAEDRDARDKKGMSALSWAVQNCHPEVVRLLCTKKANPNLKDSSGRTPLAIAREIGNSEIEQILVEFGAKTP